MAANSIPVSVGEAQTDLLTSGLAGLRIITYRRKMMILGPKLRHSPFQMLRVDESKYNFCGTNLFVKGDKAFDLRLTCLAVDKSLGAPLQAHYEASLRDLMQQILKMQSRKHQWFTDSRQKQQDPSVGDEPSYEGMVSQYALKFTTVAVCNWTTCGNTAFASVGGAPPQLRKLVYEARIFYDPERIICHEMELVLRFGHRKSYYLKLAFTKSEMPTLQELAGRAAFNALRTHVVHAERETDPKERYKVLVENCERLVIPNELKKHILRKDYKVVRSRAKFERHYSLEFPDDSDDDDRSDIATNGWEL